MSASTNKRAITGIILVAVGALFLMDNIGFGLDIPRWIFTWPIVFIAIGFVNVLSGNYRGAFFFFTMGVFFYLQQYGYVDMRTYWPVILILVGLSFIFNKKGHKKTNTIDLDYFDELSVFGGTEKKLVSNNLKGGKITSIFGGSEIDLRGSTIQDGAVIEIFTMFGGCDILVPEDWKVHVDTIAIFGGFSDSRRFTDPNAVATVKIKGFTMFGGGEIKN